MTIENLEALERAATAGPMRIHAGYVPNSDYPHLATLGEKNDTVLAKFASVDEANTTAAYRNALGPLLAVAKAAKAYCVLSHAGADTHDAYLELWEALDKLDATP